MANTERPGPQEYRELFETDRRGSTILEDLVLRFSRPAVTKGGIDAVLETFKRVGQNEVVNFIVQQINRANGVQINEGDPE